MPEMTEPFEWSKRTYEGSVTSRCWWFTGYDDGWRAPGLADDGELQAIVRMERESGDIPGWASKIVETSIRSVPPCGHYTFPRAYLETSQLKLCCPSGLLRSSLGSRLRSW